MSRRATVGTVYLLHFDRPFGHALHYTGWTSNLAARLHRHAHGDGANLTNHVRAAGIGWTLVRVWPESTRHRERALKNQGGASRRCPICQGWDPLPLPEVPLARYCPN